MKRRALSMLLCLSLLLAMPVLALSPDQFRNGALCGMAALPEGGLLAADSYNKVIWKVEGETVSIFAGAVPVEDLSGEPQGVRKDGPLAEAGFASPWAVAAWNGGWAVSDKGALRLIKNGAVTTVSSSFNLPRGLAADEDGNLYVAELSDGSIRRVSAQGNVTTFATGFTEPMGLCWHGGALYVAETGRNRILRVRNGQKEVLCGLSLAAEDYGVYYGGYVDGPADIAELDHPQAIAVGEDGAVYIADTGNGAIRVLRDGRVDTLARSSADKLIPAAPRGLLLQGNTLLAGDGTAGSILSLSVAPASFRDVAAESWYAEAVNAAAARGLAEGTSAGQYEPQGTVTRAMFVTFLSRLYRITDGSALLDGDEGFTDVSADVWYAAAARWGRSTGLVNGVSEGIFDPDSFVTREQIAQFLYRFAGERGYDRSATKNLNGFRDADSAGSWALPALRWAVGTGLMEGDGSLLRPTDSATRAEVAALLIRFMEYYHI